MGREDKQDEKGSRVPGLEGGASHSNLYSSCLWLNDNDLKTSFQELKEPDSLHVCPSCPIDPSNVPEEMLICHLTFSNASLPGYKH